MERATLLAFFAGLFFALNVCIFLELGVGEEGWGVHTSFHSVVVLRRIRLRQFSSFEPLVRGGCALARDAAVRPLSIHPWILVKFYFQRRFMLFGLCVSLELAGNLVKEYFRRGLL